MIEEFFFVNSLIVVNKSQLREIIVLLGQIGVAFILSYRVGPALYPKGSCLGQLLSCPLLYRAVPHGPIRLGRHDLPPLWQIAPQLEVLKFGIARKYSAGMA